MEYLTQKKGFLGYDANHNNNPKVIIVPLDLKRLLVMEAVQKMDQKK